MKASNNGKLGTHPLASLHTYISLSIPEKLLKKIEEDIQGNNRSQKITKCVREGYKILTSGE